MKRLFLLLAFLVSFLSVGCAQTEFRKMSYTKGLEVAKSEGKLLFIDFYTTWCPPCKMMSSKIFPQKEVGDFMNKYFVCIKLDAEKLEEGAPYMDKFKIQAVPTFVILDPKKNKVIYNQSGATGDGKEFVKKMKTAIGK